MEGGGKNEITVGGKKERNYRWRKKRTKLPLEEKKNGITVGGKKERNYHQRERDRDGAARPNTANHDEGLGFK